METQQFKMLVLFSPIFVADIKIIFDYNFVAPLRYYYSFKSSVSFFFGLWFSISDFIEKLHLRTFFSRIIEKTTFLIYSNQGYIDVFFGKFVFAYVLLVAYVLVHTDADLKISLYVPIHVKILSWKCFILNPKNYWVIHSSALVYL